MRVLTPLTYYHPHWTGLTTYAKAIAEGLVARGHEVTVLTSRFEADLPEQELVGGVRVERVRTIGRVSRAAVMPTFPAALGRLLRDADLVHVHSPLPEAALVVAAARRAGVPVLVTHQGDVVMPAGAGNRAVQGAMAASLGWALRRADAVVTHNADYAAHSRLLVGRGGPVAAIEPPTVLPEPRPARVEALRRELGLVDRPVVGFAGRFVEEKGFDVLLEAMGAIRSAVPEVRCAFAGSTEVAYEDLHERCRPLLDRHDDALASLGLLRDRADVADFYGLLDLFVLPSRSDCFAAVQVEAMLCGARVVASDIPGARTVVRSTGAGRLVPAEDPAALAAAIVDELVHPRPRPVRAAVAAIYDPGRALDDYDELARAVAAGHPIPGRLDADVRRRRSAGAMSVPVDDARILDAVLANEADGAYARRVRSMVALADLADGDTVLDLGCGTGAISGLLGRLRHLRLVALDRDGGRLLEARRQGVDAGLVHGDAGALPLPDASVDAVVAAEVLEHVPDPAAALAEVARVLRPGGVVVLSVPHASYPIRWDPIGRLRDACGFEPDRSEGPITNQWSGHERLYLPVDVVEQVAAAGLELEVLEEQTPYTAPLQHVLVYSIGKPLLERDLLPSGLRASADRFAVAAPGARRARRDPVALGVALLQRADRRNAHLRGDEGRFVGIVARARKPQAAP